MFSGSASAEQTTHPHIARSCTAVVDRFFPDSFCWSDVKGACFASRRTRNARLVFDREEAALLILAACVVNQHDVYEQSAAEKLLASIARPVLPRTPRPSCDKVERAISAVGRLACLTWPPPNSGGRLSSISLTSSSSRSHQRDGRSSEIHRIANQAGEPRSKREGGRRTAQRHRFAGNP